MKIKRPSYGETRIITKFAFSPITVNSETRLWETVTIKQYYCSLGWINIRFIDKIYDNNLSDIKIVNKIHNKELDDFLNYID